MTMAGRSSVVAVSDERDAGSRHAGTEPRHPRAQVSSERHREGRVSRRARSVVGGFFLTMGGVHIGIVAAGPTFYGRFADAAFFSFVRTGWSEIFMASPVFWGLCLALGEILLGTCLLLGGRYARVGWVGVITFHLLLMLFGLGTWLWCLPALAVLVTLARLSWSDLETSAVK